MFVLAFEQDSIEDTNDYKRIRRNVRKRTFGHVRQAFAQSDQNLRGAFRITTGAKFLHRHANNDE